MFTKYDLTDIQISHRQLIIDALTSIGWKKTREHLQFDEGLPSPEQADLTYKNGFMYFHCRYQVPGKYATKECIHLILEPVIEDGIGLILNINDENITKILSLIVDFSPTLSSEKIKDFVGKLLTVCSEVYQYLGEDDGAVRLTQ